MAILKMLNKSILLMCRHKDEECLRNTLFKYPEIIPVLDVDQHSARLGLCVRN